MNNTRQTRKQQQRPGTPGRGGFTLAEVMVSLALVVMVVLGVSQVFKMSTDATGATQALSTMTRDHRAALSTLSEDFKNCVADSPAFIIYSGVGIRPSPNDPPSSGPNGAFRNLQDHMADLDGNPLTVNLNNMSVNVPVASMSDRVPRLDSFSFFTRNTYRRQTWPVNTYLSDVTANEAYIWVGHLNVVRPVQSTQDFAPERTYSMDRQLGRVAILMKDAPTIPAKEPFWSMASSANLLAPLGVSSPLNVNNTSADNNTGAVTSILGCRYDLAGATVEQFRRIADVAYLNDNAQKRNWHLPISDVRFYGRPSVVRPVSAEKLAYASPVFVGHCTQFAVEFAGDFFKQNATTGAIESAAEWMTSAGAIQKGQTDGLVDFVVDPNTGTRRVRWYGLPRDVNGDANINYIDDVVPFADVLAKAGVPNARAPWESTLPPVSSNYMTLTGAGSAQNFKYVCAFHNNAPLMIRVLIKIDDPTGKLADGQWYEYVLNR